MAQSDIPIKPREFSFQCPKTWDRLLKTNIASVRFCDACERNVYLAESLDKARGHALQGHCVAVPVELTDASKRKYPGDTTVGVIIPGPDPS